MTPDERSIERDARVRELKEHAMKQLDTINALTAEIGRLRDKLRRLSPAIPRKVAARIRKAGVSGKLRRHRK